MSKESDLSEFRDVDCSQCFTLIGKISKEQCDDLEIDPDELGLFCPNCYNNAVKGDNNND